MLDFNFEPPHWALILLAFFVAGLGYIITFIIPAAHLTTRYALPLVGLAIALSATGGAAERRGWAWSALAWLALSCAAITALWPLSGPLGDLQSTFSAWHDAGWPLPRTLWEAAKRLNDYGPAQQQANMVALLLGLFAAVLAIATPVSAVFRSRIPKDRQAKSGPWKAGWMKPADVAFLARNKTGLPLALHGRKILRYAKDDAKGWRGGHHVVISGTRGGKGVSAVIPAILEHQGPVVALDIKGENFAVTRRYRKSLGRSVIVLNPFGVVEPSLDRFNPLDYIRPDHLSRDIDVVADGLVKSEIGSGEHFAEMARQLVAGAIEVIVTQEEPERRNLNTVADILLAYDLEQTLEAWAQDAELVGNRPAQIAATILRAGDRERGSIQSTVSKAFSWMKDDAMRDMLEASSFNMDDLLDDKIDLFIVVPLDQIEAQEVFMRLFTNLVLGTVSRQSGKRTVRNPILFVLDEFVRMGRMEKVLNIATVAAGFGIEALFITQEIGQIIAKYGKHDADSILGSCITKRIFNLNDIGTAEWVERHLGDRTVYSQQRRQGKTISEGDDFSYSEQRQKLLTASEIMDMPPDETLILIGGKPPLKAKLNRYYENQAYKGKYDENPLI